jgi:predicted nucleic acid-binding protein
MGRLVFPPHARVALDTSALIYSVEKIAPYFELLAPLWQSAKQNQIQLFGSELLLLETLVKPIQQGDLILESALRNLLTNSREFSLLPITRVVLDAACLLRVQHRIRTPDAIHLATAQLAKCDHVLTNDTDWRRVTSLNVVLLDDYL